MNVTPAVKTIFFIIVLLVVLWLGRDWSIRKEQRGVGDAQDRARTEAAALEQRKNELRARLTIEDVTTGTGPAAQWGDTIAVHYRGTFLDGKQFDSSYDRGTPFTFVLGKNQVIGGWELGLEGMKAGGTRRLTIPPELGYGAQGSGPIPPSTTLKFSIELLSVNGKK